MLTYGFNVWIEATVIPFLAIMAAFLFVRYGTNIEVNRRFRMLALSTFLVTFFEVFSTLLIDGWGHKHLVNLTVRTIYYVAMNFNAYHLMRYVEAYVQVDDRKFDMFNTFLLATSFVVMVLNLTPGVAGFFFTVATDGGLVRGPYNTLWRSVYVLYFVTMAGYLQLTHKERYQTNFQYILMNVLGLVLILSFVIQYLWIKQVLFTYAVACVVLFIIFFYYEAPTYRRMNTVEKELEAARLSTEESTKMTNAANRAKSDFLANTSHEIHQAALDIRKAGNHLLSIINNILDISKIESGKMELYKTDYHLWQLIRDIEEGSFEALQDKGIKFVLDIDKELPEHLYGDEDRLRQIIINLIDNAVKYTNKGKITMSVKGTRESYSRVKLVVAIKDTGIGIRQEDLGRLFHSFERVNLNETQSIQGAGLGLTLVRYLLELMNGKIKAESEYGKGSTFTFELTQQLSQEGFEGTIKEYETMLEKQNELMSSNYEDNRPFTCPEAKILVVDDTPVNLVVAKGMLKDSKAQVETVESGEECLNLLKTNHYDLVFLDHLMPGIDGIETLNRAHDIDGPSRLAAYIALTANSGTGLREEYISYGFNDYLPKPIKSDAIKKILAKYLPENLKIRE